MLSVHITTILTLEKNPLGFAVHYQLNPIFHPIKKSDRKKKKKPTLKIQRTISLILTYMFYNMLMPAMPFFNGGRI